MEGMRLTGESQQGGSLSAILKPESAYIIGTNRKSRRERADRGFSTEDTFSFDTYLAGVIANGVAELRDRCDGRPLGSPGALLPDRAIDSGRPTEEESRQANREWRAILDSIATGFAKYAETEVRDDDVDEAFRLLREWFGALWD